MKYSFMVAGAAIMASACTTTLKVAEVDAETNRFATSSAVTAEEVKVAKEFDVDKSKSMLFIRNNFDDVAKVGEYFEGSIERFGFFDEVVRKDDFERNLIQKGLQDEVGDVSGFASLSKAAGLTGDFLFADLELEAGMGYQVTLRMDVYNARDAEELFSVERQVTNWAGLDGPLFQPVLNAFFDWIDENSDGVVNDEPTAETEVAVEADAEKNAPASEDAADSGDNA